MATFLICHGAFGGGWSWREVAERLRSMGHSVFTPTLTGLGERVHLAHREVNLSLHVQDICNVVKFEELHDVVLVGHSYGGAVAAGVAQRMPERVKQIVYIDAFVPEPGASVADLYDEERVQHFKEAAEVWGDGWLVPAPDAEINERAVSQPLGTFIEPLVQGDGQAQGIPTTYIACTNRSGVFQSLAEPLANIAARFKAKGSAYVEIDADHSPQRESPDVVVQALTASLIG